MTCDNFRALQELITADVGLQTEVSRTGRVPALNTGRPKKYEGDVLQTEMGALVSIMKSKRR